MRNRIGEIVFRLRVVVADLGDRCAKFGLVVDVQTGVHLVDEQLFVGRVARLDDAGDEIPGAHHAPESRGQRHARRHERERAIAGGERRADELAVNQRHVTV